jgi:hypothetical protein
MGWKQRLQQLVLAGGTVALANCQNCCNANPDPCCRAPEGERCKVRSQCEANGEGWTYSGPPSDDSPGYCVPLDQGPPDVADAASDAGDGAVIDGATQD